MWWHKYCATDGDIDDGTDGGTYETKVYSGTNGGIMA